MCYPKPGPRCSQHARQKLKTVLKTGDPELITQAQNEYNQTPAGIKELKAAGRDLEASVAALIRKEQLRKFRIASPVRKLSYSDKIVLAGNPETTDPDLLTAIYDDTDATDETYRAVAGNRNTAAVLLEELATSHHPLTRFRVASNPSTPPDTLTLLRLDEEELVREGVASNPSTPPAVLEAMPYENPANPIVALNISRNPAAPSPARPEAKLLHHNR